MSDVDRMPGQGDRGETDLDADESDEDAIVFGDDGEEVIDLGDI